MKRLRPLVSVLVLSLAMGGPALADASADAKAMNKKGMTKYELGDYDQAIDLFKKAYETSNDPKILFNLAQSYRKKRDYERALDSYRSFLRYLPGAPNREAVEARITELERLVKVQRESDAKPPDGVAPMGGAAGRPDPAPVSAPTPSGAVSAPVAGAGPSNPAAIELPREATEPGADSHRPIYPWVIAGVGVAAAAVGIVCLVSASGLDDDAKQAARETDALDLRDQASTRRGLGTALAIGGGVVAVTGLTLLILHPGSHSEGNAARSGQTAIVLTPATIGMRGTF